MTKLSYLGPILFVVILWMGNSPAGATPVVSYVGQQLSPTAASILPADSVLARPDRPKSLTFTASTDQRFFFFNDTRNDNGRRVPVSVYGVRAGFLFPSRHTNNDGSGGMRAAFKAGLGFYFVNQAINRPGLLPATSEAVTRHLRIATAFF